MKIYIFLNVFILLFRTAEELLQLLSTSEQFLIEDNFVVLNINQNINSWVNGNQNCFFKKDRKVTGCFIKFLKNLDKNEFSKSGSTFAGWNTKADGSGTSYKDCESVSMLSSKDGGTVRLYAQWKAN